MVLAGFMECVPCHNWPFLNIATQMVTIPNVSGSWLYELIIRTRQEFISSETRYYNKHIWFLPFRKFRWLEHRMTVNGWAAVGGMSILHSWFLFSCWWTDTWRYNVVRMRELLRSRLFISIFNVSIFTMEITIGYEISNPLFSVTLLALKCLRICTYA